MVLEILKYAKSVFKNFDQSEASIVVMWLQKVADGVLDLELVKLVNLGMNPDKLEPLNNMGNTWLKYIKVH